MAQVCAAAQAMVPALMCAHKIYLLHDPNMTFNTAVAHVHETWVYYLNRGLNLFQPVWLATLKT